MLLDNVAGGEHEEQPQAGGDDEHVVELAEDGDEVGDEVEREREVRGEHPELMAKAALLLATEPLDKVTGRVTYSQQILKEFGWIDAAQGTGVDPKMKGSGYSQV